MVSYQNMMKQATRSYPIPKKGKALMVQQAARVRKKTAKGLAYVQGKTSITRLFGLLLEKNKVIMDMQKIRRCEYRSGVMPPPSSGVMPPFKA